METIEIQVEPRGEMGKGASRQIRRQGGAPGILYGPSRQAKAIRIDARDFDKRVGMLEGSHLLRLKSNDREIDGILALAKELQRDPVTRDLLHADFYEVDVNAKLRIRVALHFIGKSQGVELGGILQPIKREVEVLCLPSDIPEYIEVNVTELGIHDAVHISDLTAPPGVEIPYDSDDAVVTVLPPVVEEVAAAPAEGEEAAAAAPAAGTPEAEKAEGAKKPEAAKKPEGAKAAT
jgi:large subunit ribosomal protein L25